MTARRLKPQLATLAVVFTSVLLTGCSPLPDRSGAANSRDRADRSAQTSPSASPDARSQPGAAGDSGNQGGQNSPTGYTDARFHYRLTGPGPLTARPDGTASFLGEDELLEVAVVEGAQAADPMAVAQAEVSSLSNATPNVRITSRPAQVTLGGQSMVKFSYTWTAKSQASGQQIKMTGVRYLIPKSTAAIAVVRYGDASSQFDTQEADGFAGSFRWL
jgi:hypothetical protein